MKNILIIISVVLVFSAWAPVIAQEDDTRIIIRPDRFISRPPVFQEPIPLDRTIKLVIKLEGPEGAREITLLCATTVYGVDVGEAEESRFSVAGTIRMVRSSEVLITLDFETMIGELELSGNSSVKIRLGKEKTVFKYGDYTVSVHVDVESD